MTDTEHVRKLRVLHVEDSEVDRDLISRALSREGFHCTFTYAINEKEFREALETVECDLILSDVSLPTFTGAEALTVANTLKPDVPFIFVSGTIGEERAVESLKCGATDYVLKDRLERMGPAVGRALREARGRTKRLQAEQMLRASEERFRQVVENIREVFWLSDPDTRTILYVSSAYETIWGRTCDSLYELPCSWLEAIHCEDRERIRDAVTTKQPRGDYDETYQIIRPDGSLRWIHDRAFPLRDASGNIYRIAGLAEDITKQRTLEEQFRQSQKMESIGQLAGGVAHDFNNILSVIQGHASLMASRAKLVGKDREAVNEISLAAERAATLVRQLLTCSRRQPIQPGELNLNEVIEGTLKMLRRVLGEDVALQFTAGDIHSVLADAGMIEQVLMNLAVNARDAMPNGGTLDIRTRTEYISQQAADQSPGTSAGQFTWLEVTDTGSGIAPENLPKIFEPFFTTKEVGKGTGLGLATVYGIVKQHRGWIIVESKVNHGTQFKIYLPATRALAKSADKVLPEEQIHGGSETILAVEDETSLLEVVGEFLESYGYRVLLANSGKAALEHWEKHRESIDLLLTDLVMPGGVSGAQLAEALWAENDALKVVFTSGYSPEVLGQDARFHDRINFLQKPYTRRTLGKCVRSCLDRSSAS